MKILVITGILNLVVFAMADEKVSSFLKGTRVWTVGRFLELNHFGWF
jgi:hypothetical protein